MTRNTIMALAPALLAALTVSGWLVAREPDAQPRQTTAIEESPSRGIVHAPGRTRRAPEPDIGADLRSFDGRGNNLADTDMGAAYTALLRVAPADYTDGIAAMAGTSRPGPREVSNTVCAQSVDLPNPLNASDFLWQWGQFLDHDIDLTDSADPVESAPIAVPLGDPFFDPFASGTMTIPFHRSLWDPETGTDTGNPRQQLNEISAWIDASQVYGSDTERADALRTLDGTGRLRTSEGNLLPFNVDGLPNAGGTSPSLYLAGDVRANEQVGLTALHTLFVREHNRLVAELATRHPDWTGEQLYQQARLRVAAQMQVITYSEYLPALLGRFAPGDYRGYRPNVDARIGNLFSGALYRYGHSALSPTLLRLDAQGRQIADGHLPLRDAFFAPARIQEEGGIAPLLRGLARQTCQRVDPYVIDDVRNFLFGPPGAGGFDLASLNIQRGRDHGLPSYNDTRRALGLGPAGDFAAISPDPEIHRRLSAAYATVDDVDLWIGALAERPLPGAHVGELIALVIRRQFESLRDGDRFWFEHDLPAEVRDVVRTTRLVDVIRRNTEIDREIQDNVFRIAGSGPEGAPRPGPGPQRR